MRMFQTAWRSLHRLVMFRFQMDNCWSVPLSWDRKFDNAMPILCVVIRGSKCIIGAAWSKLIVYNLCVCIQYEV